VVSQTEINFLCIKLLKFRATSASSVRFCTPDDALVGISVKRQVTVVQNILSFIHKKIIPKRGTIIQNNMKETLVN
jgi:hypothetical protein